MDEKLEIIDEDLSQQCSIGVMWKNAFIFKERNPHLSLENIMKMTLEHWNDGTEEESLKPYIQDLSLRFISEFKYHFDIL